MKEEQLSSEFVSMAKQLGIPPEQVVSLCSKMLQQIDMEKILSAHSEQYKSIQVKTKILQAEMRAGARRANGSLKFPV